MSEIESYITEKLHELATRVYRLESILMNPPTRPPDFTKEDSIVRGGTAKLKAAEEAVEEAKDRIPHP